MDTSRSVIGVVLLKDGKPIAYVSKSFTRTQQREMELLNKKCWQLYLLVRGFINTSMGRKSRLKVIINH